MERARDSHAGEWAALSVPEQEAMLFRTVLARGIDSYLAQVEEEISHS